MPDAADVLYPTPSAPTTAAATTTATAEPAQVAPSIAERLYAEPAKPMAEPVKADPAKPTAEPSKPEAVELTPERQAELLDAIQKNVPEAVLEDRARRGRDLYDAVPDSIQRSIPADEFNNLPEPIAKAVVHEVREMAVDAGIDGDGLTVLRAALAESRATPMTDEQRLQSREACVQAFNDAFRGQAKAVWAQTRAWVAQDPRRAAILAQVGDNPRVALMAASLAMKA